MFKITSNNLNYYSKDYTNQSKIRIPGWYSPVLTKILNKSDAIISTNFTNGTPIQLDSIVGFITSVVVNGTVLLPALDPQNPQLNEFVYNPYTNQLKIYSNYSTAVISYNTQSIKISPSIVNNLPDIFYYLPIEGQITIGRSFENHPSASFSFETHYTKDHVYDVFRPGRELKIYGIGLRVSSISFSELPLSIYPDGRIKVNVSFQGKWENYLDKPCFLKSNGRNLLSTDNPFTDSTCTSSFSDTQQDTSRKEALTMESLFSRIGILLVGSNLLNVYIPSTTAINTTVNPYQLLQERLRLANSFVRFSNFNYVEILKINGLKTHVILESDLLETVDSSYEGIDKYSKENSNFNSQQFSDASQVLYNFPNSITSPSSKMSSESDINLGFEYAVVELTGEFSQTSSEKTESTQGQRPKYIRKPVIRTTEIEGNVDADKSPSGIKILTVMSLCFDLGGEQQSRTFVTKENGDVIQTIEEVWGFVFTAEDIYNINTGKYSGIPDYHWKCIKRLTTQYVYDTSTGYLIRKIGQGFNTVRWKVENADKPETLGIIGDVSSDATKVRDLYTHFQIPIIERHSRRLKLMPEYNTEDYFEEFKSCNRDGTVSVEYIINPDYSPPYYIDEERTEKVSFSSRSNPNNYGLDIQAGDILEPDLYVGSVEIYESKILSITPAVYEKQTFKKKDSTGVIENKTKDGKLLVPQKWKKYNRKFSAQGQNIATALEEEFTEEGTGNPPSAEPKRSPQYKKETDISDSLESDESDYKYYIWTKGYDYVDDPVSGSESFTLATTFDEAIVAAKCKLAIENWRNGFNETIVINFDFNIKEGDRLQYYCRGQLRDRVVISVNHQLNILGSVNGSPFVTGTTSLQLGKYTNPTLYYRKEKMKSSNSYKDKVPAFNAVNKELDGLLNWSLIKSRRNP